MGWTSIAWVMPKKIRTLGLEKFFQFAELKDDWDKILTRAINIKFIRKSRPINLKNETLVVDCLNSIWANELKIRELRILEEIKKTAPQIKIEKISFIS